MSQDRQLGLGDFLLDVVGDVGAGLHGRENDARRHFPAHHLGGAAIRLIGLDALDDVRARRRNRHQHQSAQPIAKIVA